MSDVEDKIGHLVPVTCDTLCSNTSAAEEEKCQNLCFRRRFGSGTCIPNPNGVVVCCCSPQKYWDPHILLTELLFTHVLIKQG